MKKEEFNQSLQNMQELSMESCEMIHGGETAWYWVGYFVGSFLHGMTSGAPNSGQRVYNMALG
ncbi:MAG: hypothetical protein ABIY90_02510 [Puia sp.]